MALVEHVYHLTEAFPKHEAYGLTGQMRRAAISIPSNIAEGHAREHRKEYLHHVSIAKASLAELRTHLEIAARLRYGSPEPREEILEQCALLGKELHALRNALMERELVESGRRTGNNRRHKETMAGPHPLTQDPRPLTPNLRLETT